MEQKKELQEPVLSSSYIKPLMVITEKIIGYINNKLVKKEDIVVKVEEEKENIENLS